VDEIHSDGFWNANDTFLYIINTTYFLGII